MTKLDILQLLSENRAAIAAFRVERLALFGSHARGDATANSDVDFLVEFAPDCKTFDNFMGLALFLEDLLGKRIELLTPESLSPYIGPHILSEAEYADVST